MNPTDKIPCLHGSLSSRGDKQARNLKDMAFIYFILLCVLYKYMSAKEKE